MHSQYSLFKWIGGLFAVLALPALAAAQTARVQVIHNSPYAEAAVVDVYVNGARAIDDFAFRAAAGYLDLPASTELTIDITAPDAPDNSAPVFTKAVTLADNETYVLVAAGDPLGRAGNPAFDLFAFAPGQEASAGDVDLLVFHGAPDAPAVDIPVLGTGLKLADDLAFGAYQGYATVGPAAYVLGISPADDADETILAKYTADVAGLAGGAAVALASGFLSPADGDPSFSVIVVLPDATVLTLPGAARAQVIHNSPFSEAASVDVYINDALAIDNFGFQQATPYIDLPAETELSIDITGADAPDNSAPVFSTTATLTEGGTFVLTAAGDPLGRAGNPAFDLFAFAPGQEASAGDVDLLVFHGAPDAPAVDIPVLGTDPVLKLADDLEFGQYQGYATVPADSYTIGISPADDADETILTKYVADVSGLGGGAAVALASGFLAGDAGSPGFGIIVVLADGSVISLPGFARTQVIHNSPYAEAALVDVYINDELAIDDMAFQDATPFIDLPADTELTIDLTAADAPDNSSPVFTKTLTLETGGTYVVVAAGDPLGRAEQPVFDLFAAAGSEVSPTEQTISLIIFHGAPDAPAVDIPVRGTEAKLADDLAFGTFQGYVEVPEGFYPLGISPADDADASILATFIADNTGSGGQAQVVLASGFLAPQEGDPGFGIIGVSADGSVGPLSPVGTVADARAASSDASSLAIEATVTRAKGRIVRLQDATAGIATFASSGPFADAVEAGDIALGDWVILQGDRADFGSAQQLRPTGFSVISRGNPLPEAQEVTLADIVANGEEYESELIRVLGLSIDAAGDEAFSAGSGTGKTYQITDPTDETNSVTLRVPNQRDTDIVGAPIPTAPALFEGVLAQFSSSDPNAGYQLSPVDSTDVRAQTARVQIVHNSADPTAAVVDVYINKGESPAIDDFAFRSATPFIDLPAATDLTIDVAPGSSTSVGESVATVEGVRFEVGTTYVVVAGGILGDGTTPFGLFVSDKGREDNVSPEQVDVLIFHGATDAPDVDVIARPAGATLADDLAYGTFIPDYVSIDPALYFLDVTTADNSATAASFGADARGAPDGAALIVASGFLSPTGEQAPFALVVVGPDGSTEELPNLASSVLAQIIHSAADPAADVVDVYVDGAKALDDFGYQTATPFIFLPAEMNIQVTLGGNESPGEGDPSFDVALDGGGKYVVVASGLLVGGDETTSFTLLPNKVGDVLGKTAADVDLLVVHTVTDAPEVNIETGGTLLVEALAYSAAEQLAVPEGSYVLDVKTTGGALVESFAVDLTGAGDQLLSVVASGFLAPPDGSSGREFGLFAVNADGESASPPIVTDVDETFSEVPGEFALRGNYPNPFNPSTTIQFDLPESAIVGIEVFDMLGRRVMTVQPQSFAPGQSQEIRLDAAGLSSGLYVYRVRAEIGAETMSLSGRMTLLK